MKKIICAAALLATIFSLHSCLWSPPDTNAEPIEEFDPVTMTRAELEGSVQFLPPQGIVKSGKIYTKDNLMFINDVNKGFHAYNYSDPENPIAIGFIKIPGATDLAIRGEFIYINQAVDLVTFVYDDDNNTITESHRNENVFPQKISPSGWSSNVPANQIIVDWIPQQ